jgi:hypothetical protein
MRMYCLAPKGEPAASRDLRMRQFEDFFSASGLANPDDSVLYEQCQSGLKSRPYDWLQGYARGMDVQIHGPSQEAHQLGIKPALCISAHFDLQTEISLLPPYREWKRLMEAAERTTTETQGRTAAAGDPA